MARKMMTREVTKTTVKMATMDMRDGLPVAVPLVDEVFIGNVSLEQAQRKVDKMFEKPVTVLEVLPETNVYEMPVEEFIKHARIKETK